MTTVLAPATPRSDLRAGAWLTLEILGAVAVPVLSAGLALNWFFVYFRLFGVAPNITPFTLGVHRVLLLAGVVAVAATWAGARARGGWRWAAAATALMVAAACTITVQGAVPGLG